MLLGGGPGFRVEDLRQGRRLAWREQWCGNSDQDCRKQWRMWKSRRTRWPWRTASRIMAAECVVIQSTRGFARKSCKSQNVRLRKFCRGGSIELVTTIGDRNDWRVEGSGGNRILAGASVSFSLPTENLPLQVSNGLVLENLGKLYKGSHEEKYWSHIQRGLRHPLPVGYTAIKTYRGVEFKQTIEEGPKGPLFVVGEVGKAAYSADTPAKAWSLALSHSQLESTTRVHGRKHFGFDLPVVLRILTELDEDQEPPKSATFSEETAAPEREDVDPKPVHYPGDEAYASTWSDENLRGRAQKQLFPQNTTKVSQKMRELQSPSLVRLRSVIIHRVNQDGDQVSLLNGNHPSTRGLSDMLLKDPHKETSEAEGSLPGTAFAVSRSNAIKQNSQPLKKKALKRIVSPDETSLGSILRKMDELAPIDRHVSITDKSSNRDISEQTTASTSERQTSSKQRSSPNRPFGSPARRSSSFARDSAGKDLKSPSHTTSLANILEKWNDGVKFKADERRSQQPMPLPLRKEGVLAPRTDTDELGQAPEDVEKRVTEWISGEEGQQSVLAELRYLTANKNSGKALQILTRIHASGVKLPDMAFSAFFAFEFDTWQKQAIEYAQKASVLICAPGGAGKFTVAARMMYQAQAEGKRCLLVTPLESSVEQSHQYVQELFGERNVGTLPSGPGDAVQQNHPVTVMTLQTLVTGLRERRARDDSSWTNVFEDVGLVVMDRFQSFGLSDCGSYWEEAVILLDKETKLIALSLPRASEDARDIASWISSAHKSCELASHDTNPLPKTRFYYDKDGLHEINDKTLDEPTSFCGMDGIGIAIQDENSVVPNLIRMLLQSSERFLPAVISFPTVEDSHRAAKNVNEVMEGVLSPEEVLAVESRVADYLNENPSIQQLVDKDELNALSRGYSFYHGPQLSAWASFVQSLVKDNLVGNQVKIRLGTNSMLVKSGMLAPTVAICLQSKDRDVEKYFSFIRDAVQLEGKAGRRGDDSSGHVIYFGSAPGVTREELKLAAASPLDARSCFRPSYSLLLNLLGAHSIPEVKRLVESNFGDFIKRRQRDEELAQIENQLAELKERKGSLVAELLQKLAKVNSIKLQDAATFTLVDVRITQRGVPWGDYYVPGILCAVLPGPSELLYVILDAKNNFRLVPAGALDHVYSDEERLDTICAAATGRSILVPPLSSKEKWKKSPGENLEFTSEGTAESQHLVELLLQYGVTHRRTEEELACRENIKSCDELLTTLWQQKESLSSAPSASWSTSEKLIQILEEAGAIELSSNDTLHAKLKPLGVLISKLHTVENELWYATALSSSVLKPLTAPELAGICSAFISTNQDNFLESSSFSAKDTPKRLRDALEKLENLRANVERLQGSNDPPVVLEGHAVATVYSLCGELASEGNTNSNLNTSTFVDFIRKIISLLQVIDNVWGRNTHVLSALQGTSGLHNLAKRAVHLLQKYGEVIEDANEETGNERVKGLKYKTAMGMTGGRETVMSQFETVEDAKDHSNYSLSEIGKSLK